MEFARTLADGCERLRTVANGSATSSEHTLNPQTPRVKREPLLRIRENHDSRVRENSEVHIIHPEHSSPPSCQFMVATKTLYKLSTYMGSLSLRHYGNFLHSFNMAH